MKQEKGQIKVKNLKASVLADQDEYIKQEDRFSKQLETFNSFKVHSPITLFIKNYKQEKLSINSANQQEQALRFFMLLMEMEKMNNHQEQSPEYIANLVKIIKGEDLHQFKKQINVIRNKIKQIVLDHSFRLPPEDLMLQKKGKVTRFTRTRNVYMTNQKFGQIKNKNTKKLFKPKFFADQRVYVESKNQITEVKQKEIQMKKDKTPFTKVIKWMDINNCNYRVRFVDKFSDRQRCIYVKSQELAQMIKNNAICQRIFKENPERGKLLKILMSFWKIKQTEFFYQNYLKQLFQDKEKRETIMNDFNVKVQEVTKEYIKNFHPNLYDSNYNPMDTYNFTDNSHLKIQVNAISFDDKLQPQNFATVVQDSYFDALDENEIYEKKKNLQLQNSYSKLNVQRIINPVVMMDFVDSFLLQKQRYLSSQQSLQGYYNSLLKNNLLILNFNKLILNNFMRYEGIHINESEINNLIFSIEGQLGQGVDKEVSMTFLEETTNEFLSFNIDASFQVDINTLSMIKFKIQNKLNLDEVLFEEQIDLKNQLDQIKLENMLFYPFHFDYKGIEINAVLNFILVVMPRNLEVAHTVLNQNLIDTNFERFGYLLQNIKTYSDFQKKFFDLKYLEIKNTQENQDYFFYLNNALQRNNDFVNHQENMFLNSFRDNNLQDTKILLKNVFGDKFTYETLFKETFQSINKQDRKNLNFVYDILSKIAGLISPSERLLIGELIIEHYLDNYINFDWNHSQALYHKTILLNIYQQTEKFFEQNDHYSFSEKLTSWSVIVNTYLILENNNKLNENFPYYFSKHYISLIVKLSQINSKVLNQNQVVKLAVQAILNQSNLHDYSHFNNLHHLNNALIYFKIVFKRLFFEEYTILMNKMVSFDQLFLKQLVNSFSDVLDTINLNTYIDFKNFTKCLLISQENHMKMLNTLQKLGITFHNFIDLLYFMIATKNYINYIEDSQGHLIQMNILKALQFSQRNFLTIISEIFETITFLQDRQFLLEEYNFFQQIVNHQLQKRAFHFQNFNINVKTLKIKKQQIIDIITQQLENNNQFLSRAFVLFNTNQKESSPQKEFIDEDIFFDVANDYKEEFNFDDFQTLEKKRLPKYMSCVLFLNNIDQKLIENATNNTYQQNLHTINLMKNQEFELFFKSASESLKKELYLDLIQLQQSDDVSIMKLIISIILTYTDNQKEIKELLSIVCDKLTSIYYPNTDKHFDQVVAFIMNEIYSFLPFINYESFQSNTIENFQGETYCHILTGIIFLNELEIDITHICKRHFIANSYITQRHCIQFNRNFCKDIEEVFTKMVNNREIKINFDKFEVYINVLVQEKSQEISVPFKIFQSPEIHVISKTRDPIYFTPNFGSQNLLKKNNLEEYFEDSPFCFYEIHNTVKSPLIFLKQNFGFKYYYMKEQFLNVNIKFSDVSMKQVTDVLNWSYKTPKNFKIVEFQKSQFTFELPLSHFFLTIGELLRTLNSIIVENLEIVDVFKFIQINNREIKVKTKLEKNIDLKNHIFELKEYENIAQNEKVEFYITIDSQSITIQYFYQQIMQQLEIHRFHNIDSNKALYQFPYFLIQI